MLHGAVVTVEILRPATKCGTQNPRFAQNDKLRKNKFKDAGRKPAVQKTTATASKTTPRCKGHGMIRAGRRKISGVFWRLGLRVRVGTVALMTGVEDRDDCVRREVHDAEFVGGVAG